jgi:hypothetical protein
MTGDQMTGDPMTGDPMTDSEAPVRSRPGVIDLRSEKVRYGTMMGALQLATRLALVAALAGMILPREAGTVASGLAVAIVIATPLVRVAWLAVRWWIRHDRRYAAVAASLLLVIATGSALAVLTR